MVNENIMLGGLIAYILAENQACGNFKCESIANRIEVPYR